MMLITGQGPQCIRALEGVRAGHLFRLCPSPGHWTHWWGAKRGATQVHPKQLPF